MKKKEFYLPSSNGTSRLHCIQWIPDGEIHACLQIAHGMTEHIERYEELAEYLAERGICVYGNDHLGHGMTASDKTERGFFGEKDGAVLLVKDMRRLWLWGKRAYPEGKHFLLGHSMGSFLVRRYLTAYGDGPDGVILSGTGAHPGAAVAAGVLLASFVCRTKGAHYRDKLLYEMSLGNYNRKFAPVKTASDWLSRDEESVKAFEADERCSFVFTAGAYRDFFNLILKTQRLEKEGKIHKEIPVLFLSGTMDPVGEQTRGVSRVYGWFDRAGVHDLTKGLYEGARHEVFHEINRQEVFSDTFDWLARHL